MNKINLKNFKGTFNPNIATITLNINDLNTLIKRQKLEDGISKHGLTTCFLQENLLIIMI